MTTRISTFGRWPDREDLALDHAKMAEFAGAILAPDMRPLAGFASFAGEAVVYLMDPRTLQVLRQVTVTGECLAVLTDRLCDLERHIAHTHPRRRGIPGVPQADLMPVLEAP